LLTSGAPLAQRLRPARGAAAAAGSPPRRTDAPSAAADTRLARSGGGGAGMHDDAGDDATADLGRRARGGSAAHAAAAAPLAAPGAQHAARAPAAAEPRRTRASAAAAEGAGSAAAAAAAAAAAPHTADKPPRQPAAHCAADTSPAAPCGPASWPVLRRGRDAPAIAPHAPPPKLPRHAGGAAAADGDDVALPVQRCVVPISLGACSICWESISAAALPGSGGELTELRPCEHVYHAQCIAPWLASQNTCPQCRVRVTAQWGAALGLVPVPTADAFREALHAYAGRMPYDDTVCQARARAAALMQ
jgi:hypothetical protein